MSGNFGNYEGKLQFFSNYTLRFTLHFWQILSRAEMFMTTCCLRSSSHLSGKNEKFCQDRFNFVCGKWTFFFGGEGEFCRRKWNFVGEKWNFLQNEILLWGRNFVVGGGGGIIRGKWNYVGGGGILSVKYGVLSREFWNLRSVTTKSKLVWHWEIAPHAERHLFPAFTEARSLFDDLRQTDK